MAQRDSSAMSAVDSAASYRYVDSAGLFNPDGYYAPVGTIGVDGFQIAWVGMNTVEYYYSGASHYDRPRLLLPAKVTLWLSDGTAEGRSTYPCVQTLVSPDSVSARCLNTPIGEVSIDGHLLDKSGEYFNKSQYDDGDTVLMIARLVITKDGATLHDSIDRFTWWNGD